VGKLKAKLVVVGYNFRFGRGAEGSVETLRKYSNFFNVDIIPQVSSLHHLDVSSSSIRQLLRDGDMERAAEILGRPYKLMGSVDFGRRVGRSLGFPTANLSISLEMTVIKSGVYVTTTTVDSVVYPSVTNVGVNPTFKCESVDKCRKKGSSLYPKGCEGECEGMFSIETHIIGFDGDIYGKIIEVEFLKRIRDEERFSSVEELKDQIGRDVQMAKSLLYTG
jgi:riboflavin kinase / FMN adenylyltransferase